MSKFRFAYGRCAVCDGVLDKNHAGFSVCLIGGVLTDIVVFHDNSYRKLLKKVKRTGTGVEFVPCGSVQGVLNQTKGVGARSGYNGDVWFVAVGNIAEVFDALEAGFPIWSDNALKTRDNYIQQRHFVTLLSKYLEIPLPNNVGVLDISRSKIIVALNGLSGRHRFVDVKHRSKTYLLWGRRLVEITPLVKTLLLEHGSSFAQFLVSVLSVMKGKRWVSVCRELGKLCDGKKRDDIMVMTTKWLDRQSVVGFNQLSSNDVIQLLHAIFIPVPVQRVRV